jgi:tetraacyldisaccharide 4'-kinase
VKAFIARAWQDGHVVMWLLWPLTLLYRAVIALRKKAYQYGILPSTKLSVPVVVVGNITVGGNGKTPMVIWLASHFSQQGLRVGIISRGYGGSATEATLVEKDTPVTLSGDEPKLLVANTGCLMAIGADRIAAAQLIISKANDEGKPLDIIISDDGLQHYRLQRDVEIAVVDGHRRFGNGKLLPMGPLREPQSRLKSVDLVVCNGGNSHYDEETLTLIPGTIRRISDNKEVEHRFFTNKEIIAIAGIGHPPRFFATLKELNIVTVSEVAFADHQPYTAQQLGDLTTRGQCLLMTEKDAVKCQEFAQDNWYYLPVTADITLAAKEKIFNKLKELN